MRLKDMINNLEKVKGSKGSEIIKVIKKARDLKIEGDRPASLKYYNYVIEKYEKVLGKDILADLLIETGHINLTLKKFDKSENCVVVVMRMKGLDTSYYARAQILKAHTEANKGNFVEAQLIIDNAENKYPAELLYTLNRITIRNKMKRSEAN